jgi:predicted ester cyclase
VKLWPALCTLLALALPIAAGAAPPLTEATARDSVAPFYAALSAGADVPALLERVTAADWLSCSADTICRERDKVAAAIANLHKAVPDLQWRIGEVLVAGDRVIVRGEASGTPAAEFLGVAPGGKSFRLMSIDIHTIRDGRILRSYHVEDWLGAVRQLAAR